MAFNITTRTRGLQANALLGVIEEFFLVFFFIFFFERRNISLPGFLWPGCVCKRSEHFGMSEGREYGFGIAYRAFGEDMKLG
jgi:hypothetical protein